MSNTYQPAIGRVVAPLLPTRNVVVFPGRTLPLSIGRRRSIAAVEKAHAESGWLLTVAQRIPLTGVAIVATPQDIALDIAVKALQMFRSLNVTPLGLIENMSWFVCPDCGHEHHVFGHGGAERAAQRLGVPFLGGIPLDTSIREEADRGSPIVLSQPDSVAARAFSDVASQIAARTSIQSFRRLPVINVR